MADQMTEDELLAKARKLREKHPHLTLGEAIEEIERVAANGESEINTRFELTINLKPRVAKFFRETFANPPKPFKSDEEWMAAWLVKILNQQRGQALAKSRDLNPGEIPDAPGSGSMALHAERFAKQKG